MNIIDCFCGAGGFGLGFENIGFSIIYAFDEDDRAIATYRHNGQYHYCPSFVRNAYKISKRSIEADLGESLPSIDVMIGSPYCKRFSLLGGLTLEYIRLVKEIQPRIFVMENIRGLMTKRGYFYYGIMKKLLDEDGYDLYTKHVIPSFYGVPQNSPRTFIIGKRKDIRQRITFPKGGRLGTVTVREAIQDLMLSDVGYNHDRFLAFTGNRLKWDEPAVGLDSRFYNTVGHPELNRAITLREGARLFTYPDDYEFIGTPEEIAKQIAESTPVRLAECIAGEVRSILE